MGEWKECKSCGNDDSGDMIYLCKADNHVFCQSCGNKAINIHGNHNCICPICDSTSDVRILGEIDPDAYEGDNHCENCGNVDSSDNLYRCTEDDLLFCQECGDKTYNVNGYYNCICPICHSTSDTKILGEMNEDEDDDDSDYKSSQEDDDDSDDNTSNSSSSNSRSSGGCFITTACVTARNLDDNCYELELLRTFRDHYVASLPEGNWEIDQYYNLAPVIIDHVNNRPDSLDIWNTVFEEILISISHIEEKRENEAYKNYKEVISKLYSLAYHDRKFNEEQINGGDGLLDSKQLGF